MLTHLALQNFVLIDQLSLDVRPGLGVITGETGAGKSILLSGLGLVTGARVQPGLIGPHNDRAEVSASFALPADHPCQHVLAVQELDQGEELILRRTVNADGRTRAFVNGQTVPLALLAELGTHLVEIQGQFDQLAILNPGNHRRLLDEALDLQEQISDLRKCYEDRRMAARVLKEEERRLAALAEDQDYLEHCLEELRRANLEAGEAEALNARRQTLRNLRTAADALDQLSSLLGGNKGITEQIAKAAKLASRLPGDLAKDMESMITSLDQAWNASESAASELSEKLYDLKDAERNLEETSQRIFLLNDLARKHDCQPDDLPQLQSDLEKRLCSLGQGQDRMRQLREDLSIKRATYLATATEISEVRRSGAQRLAARVDAELPDLRLPEAQLRFAFDGLPDDKAGPEGFDRVHITVRTNRGGGFEPLEKTASGGELSRILLAIKLALAPNSGTGPLLVFDEADTGIGGATAAALGSRLRRLGQKTQVLVVTHSPQLAAAGSWHLKVTKTKQGHVTGSRIDPLNCEARTAEIARMIAGAEVGDEAMGAAKKLQQEFA